MVEVLDQETATDNESNTTLDLEALFTAAGPDGFKTGVSEILRNINGSQSELEKILASLRDLEIVMNAATKSGPEKGQQSIQSLSELEQLYLKVIKPAFRKKKTFTDFLYGYLQEVVKVFSLKHAKYLEQIEKSAAHISQREQAKTRQELIPQLRQELAAEMAGRNLPADYSPEDRGQINRFESKLGRQAHAAGKDARQEDEDYSEQTREREMLLGSLLEKSGLFGKTAKVWHADKYDDYFTHADLAVDTKEGPALIIDLTFSLNDAGEKMYYNQEHPVRALSYPPAPELKGRNCLPVVLGISQSDAEEVIEFFLAEQAKEKSGGQAELAGPRFKAVEQWYDYILIQLQHQREYIEAYSLGATPGKEAKKYSAAVEQYNEAIAYFEKLKKERCPSLQLDRQRIWDSKFLSLGSTISSFETRAGLADDPPSLPESLEAA